MIRFSVMTAMLMMCLSLIISCSADEDDDAGDDNSLPIIDDTSPKLDDSVADDSAADDTSEAT